MNLFTKNVLFSREKNFWSKNRIKILSSVIATLIWFLIVTGGTFDYQAPIKITYPDHHVDYIITNQLPQTGKILLRGQGINLLTYQLFNEGRMNIEPDWADGTQTVYPSLESVFLTGNAQKIQALRCLEPDSIVMVIEKLDTKSVNVVPDISLTPQNGYTQVGDMEIDPSTVFIRAPKSVIDTLKSVTTENLVLTNLKYPVKRQVNLIDPDIPHLELLTTKVNITADIQKLLEKKIINIPIRVVNLPPHVTAIVIPASLSLVVQGGMNVVFPVQATDIDAYIDFTKQRNKQQDYPAYIRPIPGIRFTNIEPQRFKVILKREDS